MPVTLDQQPPQNAHDEHPGLLPGAVLASPDSAADAGRTRATATSPETDRRIDVGAYITPVVAGFLALATAGAVIVGAAGWADLNPFPLIAAGTLVVIAGLFARIHDGGGKHTALAGALLMPVLAVAAVAAPYLDDGVGDRSYHPTAFDDVEAEYQFGIGNLEIDLRDVEFPPGEHLIEVDHGIGAVRVQLPADVSYSAVGDVSIGKIDLFDQSDDGFNSTIDAETEEVGRATVVLELETSIGYASVDSD